MKKYLCMLGVLLFVCIFGVSSVKAANSYFSLNEYCKSNALGGKTCNPRLIVVGGAVEISELKLDIRMSKLEIRSNPITLKGGWYETEDRKFVANGYTDKDGVVYDVLTLTLANSKSVFNEGTYELGTFITEQKAGVNLENCKVEFVPQPVYSFPICTTKNVNGTIKYYDNEGKETTEDNYYASCFGCKMRVERDNTGHEYISAYYGPDGRELVSDSEGTAAAKFLAQCANVSCRWDVDPNTLEPIFYGKNEQILDREIDFMKECFNISCKAVYTPTNDKQYYLDRDENFVDEKGYFASCFPCQYYNNTQEMAEQDEGYDAAYRPIYTGYLDAEGNKTDELGYTKSCKQHSCEILSDGTHYDSNGNVVSEEDYLKSCFKCRKENGKFYDENGKETTEDNWKIMCEPHKCQYLGGKYFNDKGAIVTKAEYDKACTNPKTGDKETIRMYIYIFGGFALTAAIILGSKKFAKISKVK